MTLNERQLIADYIAAYPTLSYYQIAHRHSCSYSCIAHIAGEFNLSRKTGPKPVAVNKDVR